MKKSHAVPDDEMLAEYDFRGAQRGKYAGEFGRMANIRVLAPELLDVFPDSESVNEALRTLVRVSAAATPLKRSAKTATAPKPVRKKARS
jgi:hypothetical protein